MVNYNMKTKGVMNSKRGISPVIATVLLIALVIVLALLVFLWFRSMTQEAVTKFNNENIELVCSKTQISASYDSTNKELTITNEKNIPIYQIKVSQYASGGHTTVTLGPNNDWPDSGLNQGGVYSGRFNAKSATKLIVYPVLLGSSSKGANVAFPCEEKYGTTITI